MAEEESSHFMETVKDVVASVVGSTACVYTGQPFDTVKVRMQVQGAKFKGAVACFRTTIEKEGVLALWRGSVPACVGAVSENAMAFGTNGLLKRFLSSEEERDSEGRPVINITGPIITGAITGAFVAVVLCPSDTLKCRAQVAIAQGRGSIKMKDLIHQVVSKRGYMGLYGGFAAQVMRDIPFYSSFFGTYEILCQTFEKYTQWEQSSIYFISGGLAGQVGWTVSIAPDSIKSQIQTSDVKIRILETAKHIYKMRGLRGFFAGIEVAVLRAFPANAALFMGYEYSKQMLGRFGL
mmetsp:Transcript_14868/g.32524  ORF Transcript_14868/g.32524 Transcript_14868/m.32524 type:complete len:294 (-) Transcript_14868:2115-2996(-)